ncbi:MAG TPA: hypothetical protein PK299_09445 [Anaerolineales bacterium]|nr:hypothetical protein [Anaerolineales bacterium]
MNHSLIRSIMIALTAFALLVGANYVLPQLFQFDLGQIAVLVFGVCPIIALFWGLTERWTHGNWFVPSILSAIAFPLFFLLFQQTPLKNLYIPLIYVWVVILGYTIPGIWQWLNTRRYG